MTSPHNPDQNITMPFVDDDTIRDIFGESVIQQWHPTGRLKFVRSIVDDYDPIHDVSFARETRLLHQEWIDKMTGKTEWRQVPEEDA